MSTELEEMFTALARQADAITLGGAEQARDRGRQRRNRQRAVLASAAAVILLLTGAGVVSARLHRKADPILAATTPARIRGLAQLGDPVAPLFGETWKAARIAGNRVFGLSRGQAIAIDTRTGQRLWTLPGLDDTYLGLVATAKMVLLVRREASQPDDIKAGERRVLQAYDAVTGRSSWLLTYTTDDRLVLHEDVLVQLTATDHRITAHALDSGKTLWSASGGATVISGMRVAADNSEDHYGVSSALYSPESEKAFPYTDDRLVSITAAGQVVIRDIRTGKIRSTAQSRPNPEQLLGYEGTIYTEDSGEDGRILGTPGRRLYTPHDPWYWNDFFPCGPQRLCLYEYRDLDGTTERQEAHLVMMDAATGQVLRSTAAVPLIGDHGVRLGHVMTSAGGDKGTALYDENGQARYADNGIGGFADDGNALTLTRDAGDGQFTVRGVSNIDFRKVTLGVIPELSGRCDWNDDLLTCPTGKGLYTWRLTR
ncbi:PQQ-binding-like beta-propeller repeat protein [Actinoplanes sp. NPDC020271]|uniref:outer membrane protein assembly factor BamB family protein n=1 Tax=Actinoplanes sp. NPDC020271 TaxID=3363896 RepID=UPI0037938FF7